MERTAKLSLPQSVQFGHSNSSYTYLSVLGEVFINIKEKEIKRENKKKIRKRVREKKE